MELDFWLFMEKFAFWDTNYGKLNGMCQMEICTESVAFLGLGTNIYYFK